MRSRVSLTPERVDLDQTDVMKSARQRRETGKEAPMVITPAALARLLKSIFGHGRRSR
jgi:hypothetical protein